MSTPHGAANPETHEGSDTTTADPELLVILAGISIRDACLSPHPVLARIAREQEARLARGDEVTAAFNSAI